MDNFPMQLVAHRDYVRALRPHLPPQAFAPAPIKILGIAIHTLLIILGIVAVGMVEPNWARALLSILIGHEVACLAFYGHDLSHNSIVRNPRLRYLLELLVWSPRFMPVTMWRRLHNETHHVHSNTPRDCDRQFLKPELTPAISTVERLFTPFDNPVRWNPLVWLGFVAYTLVHIILAFGNGLKQGPPSTLHVFFGLNRLTRIAFELVVSVALQVGIFALAGFDWSVYVWCGPVPIAISSGITIAYIFTNHFLNPITAVADPVQGTTSVAVPRLVDWVHCNFSYHTEHHLFPSLNSDYYPLVSRLLMEKFPEQYNRIPMLTALTRLWSVPLGDAVTPAARTEPTAAAPASQTEVPATTLESLAHSGQTV